MKNMLPFLGSLLLLASVSHAAPAGTFGDPVDTLNRYIVVENADAVAHEVGDIVVWSDISTMKVSTTTSASYGLVAGVVAFNDLPASGKGFIQTYGYHSGVTVSSATSVGSLLAASTTAESSAVVTSASSMAIIGAATAVTTSSTTVPAFIRIGPGN